MVTKLLPTLLPATPVELPPALLSLLLLPLPLPLPLPLLLPLPPPLASLAACSDAGTVACTCSAIHCCLLLPSQPKRDACMPAVHGCGCGVGVVCSVGVV